MEKNNGTSTGIGFTGVLTTIFVVLKLLKIIDWSWWWVLSPVLISSGLIILVVLVLVFSAAKKAG